MKLPKLPNPASVLDAKYTAAQMKEYAKRVQLLEREALLDLVDAYAKNNTDLAEAIRARGQA
jgi:hypothetical protein